MWRVTRFQLSCHFQSPVSNFWYVHALYVVDPQRTTILKEQSATDSKHLANFPNKKAKNVGNESQIIA